jgi:hypothetical protein
MMGGQRKLTCPETGMPCEKQCTVGFCVHEAAKALSGGKHTAPNAKRPSRPAATQTT